MNQVKFEEDRYWWTVRADPMNATPLYVAAGLDALDRHLQEAARADECYRCDTEPAGHIDPLEPEPGLCRACLCEVSAEVERRQIEDAWHELAEDEWPDLPVSGGEA